LSRVLLQLAHYHRPPGDLMPAALSEVETALELDRDLPMAHSRLGSIRHWWQWDLPGAEAAYRKGVELNPNGSFELVRLAELLAMTGRAEEAAHLAERAVELDPLNVDTLHQLGWALYLSRRFDEGIEQMSLAKETYPDHFLIAYTLAVNFGGTERYEEACQELIRCTQVFPAGRTHPAMLSALIWAHAKTGRIIEARNLLTEFLELTRARYVPNSNIAFAYFSVDDIERAMEYFSNAFDAREPQLIHWVPCAIVDPLRSDARFQEIVRGMGLEGYC
jgi:tetratricopeptide (TPR) repeat protein